MYDTYMEKIRFGSLWVGGPLTKVQEVSLASFVYYGHDITLYVYDADLKVPAGVKKADAREILAEDRLFKVKDSYASFSDMFRYNMIQKTGLAWVDADTICLSPNWNFEDNIFASWEIGMDPCVVGGVLSLPKDSEIVKYLVSSVDSIDITTAGWATMGPHLLHTAFKKYDYMKYAYHYKVFLGIQIHEWITLWTPQGFDFVMGLYDTTKCISLYNAMATAAGIDKNSLPSGSAMEFFYNRFVVHNEHV